MQSVTLNGIALDPAAVATESRISSPGLAAENELVVEATAATRTPARACTGSSTRSTARSTSTRSSRWPTRVACSRCSSSPTSRPTFRFTVTAPAHWEVLSDSPTPEPVDAHERCDDLGFEPTPRISSYITALVAGPYAVVRDELTRADGRVIPLGVFSRKSLSQYLDADYIFENTKQGFEYFEAKFGVAYPFAKYDQLFVPEYNAGAMENAGAVTFTEFYVFRRR